MKKDHVKQAAKYHSDLNVFGAVVAILEGGCVYTPEGSRAADRIIDLCKKEMQKQLRLYDSEVSAALEGK